LLRIAGHSPRRTSPWAAAKDGGLMNHSLALALVFCVAACAREESSRAAPEESPAGVRGAAAAPRPGSEHGITLPDNIEWKDAPALGPGAKVAVLEGDPTKEGYFAMRVKLPDGFRIAPHSHPCYERVTVISGTFNLGAGEKFDQGATQALPTGAYWSMEPGMRHFAWAKGETVVQVTTMGPWGINYVNPADDPRRKQ
jgi:quercetin dioxygenase-like cupin family protein